MATKDTKDHKVHKVFLNAAVRKGLPLPSFFLSVHSVSFVCPAQADLCGPMPVHSDFIPV